VSLTSRSICTCAQLGKTLPIVRLNGRDGSILRTPAQEVPPEEIGSPKIRSLVEKMVATMRAAPGVGLAAPQIGCELRVIVLEDNALLMRKEKPRLLQVQQRKPFPLKVIVNPVLEVTTDKTASFQEACLSLPGYAGQVQRYTEVTVRGYDEQGCRVEWDASGWAARILQHELDHCEWTVCSTLTEQNHTPWYESSLDGTKVNLHSLWA